jgi:predicted PP-loop superfamily ATPase
MEQNRFLKPAGTHNGSVKTDLALTVIEKKRKELIDTIVPGQLLCVGKVYLKTHDGLVRIR